MINSNQQKAIENSILGKPVYDTELCFYIATSEATNQLINQLCARLTAIYGYALYETVNQLIPTKGKNGQDTFKEENIARIRILMTNAVWDKNFVALSWIIHGCMNIFGLATMDVTVDGTLYRARI